VLLETVPVYRLADIFVASFEISFEEQLSMLDSVDLKVRLSKATELVDKHLQVRYLVVCCLMLIVIFAVIIHC
jgi:ATP-dependent Lon protease